MSNTPDVLPSTTHRPGMSRGRTLATIVRRPTKGHRWPVEGNMIELHGCESTETLRNGVVAKFRPLRADDRERLVRAFGLLDRESVYRRFFAFKSELTDAELDHIMTADPAREVALVVTVGDGADETIIGSGRYIAPDTTSARRTAEVAFIVEEDYHGLGIAGRLLRRLADIARADGIAAFEADVLAANQAMLAVFSRSGMPMSTQREQGVVHVELSLQS